LTLLIVFRRPILAGIISSVQLRLQPLSWHFQAHPVEPNLFTIAPSFATRNLLKFHVILPPNSRVNIDDASGDFYNGKKRKEKDQGERKKTSTFGEY